MCIRDSIWKKQGQRFYQDKKDMEKRYQGMWNINMMADCCIILKYDVKTVDITQRDKLFARVKSARNLKINIFQKKGFLYYIKFGTRNLT